MIKSVWWKRLVGLNSSRIVFFYQIKSSSSPRGDKKNGIISNIAEATWTNRADVIILWTRWRPLRFVFFSRVKETGDALISRKALELIIWKYGRRMFLRGFLFQFKDVFFSLSLGGGKKISSQVFFLNNVQWRNSMKRSWRPKRGGVVAVVSRFSPLPLLSVYFQCSLMRVCCAPWPRPLPDDSDWGRKIAGSAMLDDKHLMAYTQISKSVNMGPM